METNVLVLNSLLLDHGILDSLNTLVSGQLNRRLEKREIDFLRTWEELKERPEVFGMRDLAILHSRWDPRVNYTKGTVCSVKHGKRPLDC